MLNVKALRQTSRLLERREGIRLGAFTDGAFEDRARCVTVLRVFEREPALKSPVLLTRAPENFFSLSVKSHTEELRVRRSVAPADMNNDIRLAAKTLPAATLLMVVLICSGCPGSHEKNTGGDQKHLYPSEKAKKPADDETIPTPGGASGGAAGSQSSSEKKSNPTDPNQPASR